LASKLLSRWIIEISKTNSLSACLA
jgi:hypothetical protein